MGGFYSSPSSSLAPGRVLYQEWLFPSHGRVLFSGFRLVRTPSENFFTPDNFGFIFLEDFVAMRPGGRFILFRSG